MYLPWSSYNYAHALYFTEIASYIHSSEAGCILMYALVKVIAEPKGEASNRDVLSSPVCIKICIVYVCISVLVNPRHLDCAIAQCSL